MTDTLEVTSSDDIIDVRDIITRVEELEDEIESIDDMPEGDLLKDTEEGAELREELATLTALLDELAGTGGDEQYKGDWYPVTLVRDSYFDDYARQLAEDIGAINADATWPNNCIDWTQAANELQTDYSSVEFDGVTFWYR